MIPAGWMAIALAVVIVVTVASLAIFFVAGGPFGQINDAGNAIIGLWCLALAVALAPYAGGWLGVGAAAIGAAVAAAGSWLVMTGATGFLLAGLVSTVGFGCTGIWLAAISWSPMSVEWTGSLRGLARVTATAMIIGGIGAAPGVLMRIDSFDGAPAWLWLYALGWLGTYALLPILAVRLGRRLIRSRPMSAARG